MKGKGSGWKGESRRHSLARKGVKTAKGYDRHGQHFDSREELHYNHMYEQMNKGYPARILDKDLTPQEQFSMKEMGKTVEVWDIGYYEDGHELKLLTHDEWIEMKNLFASEPRITRDIHMKLAKKGWVSLYDGYYDAIVPSYRAYRVMNDLDNYLPEHERNW